MVIQVKYNFSMSKLKKILLGWTPLKSVGVSRTKVDIFSQLRNLENKKSSTYNIHIIGMLLSRFKNGFLVRIFIINLSKFNQRISLIYIVYFLVSISKWSQAHELGQQM